ncbi:MAG: CBS domain-containing protein [Chloroflexota bacterium]
MGVVFHGERSADHDASEHNLATDTLADLNLNKPLTAHVDISLAEAVGKLQSLNVGLMTLVDDDGKLVGVFTEGDVFKRVACQIEDMSKEKVKDYMTPRVTAFKDDASIAYALHLMSLHQFRHVLVTDDDGKPTGVASFRSVVHYIEQGYGDKNGK